MTTFLPQERFESLGNSLDLYLPSHHFCLFPVPIVFALFLWLAMATRWYKSLTLLSCWVYTVCIASLNVCAIACGLWWVHFNGMCTVLTMKTQFTMLMSLFVQYLLRDWFPITPQEWLLSTRYFAFPGLKHVQTKGFKSMSMKVKKVCHRNGVIHRHGGWTNSRVWLDALPP